MTFGVQIKHRYIAFMFIRVLYSVKNEIYVMLSISTEL